MSEPELKPCPFCGVIPFAESQWRGKREVTMVLHPECGIEVNVDHWNRRAPHPAAEKVRVLRDGMEAIATGGSETGKQLARLWLLLANEALRQLKGGGSK